MIQPTKDVIEVDKVISVLRNTRFRFTSERDLQNGIAVRIATLGMAVRAEHRLDAESRLDFWLPAIGLAIEVKIKGGEAALLRQLQRYASHDCVKTILVVTARMQLAALPLEIGGKPLRVLGLAGSLL